MEVVCSHAFYNYRGRFGIKRLDGHIGEDTPIATDAAKVGERIDAGEVTDRSRGRNAAPAAAAGAMRDSGAEGQNRSEQGRYHRSEADNCETNQHKSPMPCQAEPASGHV